MKRLAIAAVLSLTAILLVGAVAFASARGGTNPAPSRVTVPAPIDQVDVLIRESNPPQVTLKVMAGLPSGCAQRESHSVSRTGDIFTVSVLNSMPSGNPVCTMIYGTYELDLDLGRDFSPGTTYTVHVNDKTTTFKT
jgi:hypothetical protein